MSSNDQNQASLDQSDKGASDASAMIGWDFIFSAIIIVFSIFVVANALTMPFSGTVGGVSTTWYESPGLLPLFVGTCLGTTGFIIFTKALKARGYDLFRHNLTKTDPRAFLLSGLGILSYIFVLVTWFDFFLASMAFLLLYIGIYYLGGDVLKRQMIIIYYATIIVGALVFLTGLNEAANAGYEFSTDFLLVLCIAAQIVALVAHARRTGASAGKKVRLVIILALVFPAFLVPTFRYFLLVPMPHEGLVVEDVFNQTYYGYLVPQKGGDETVLSDEQMNELENAF
ncbi:MAG: hypothetical protein KKH72_12885 [Alphaproteobacteria bacterium]|nr:hypothetical protein [Alphaproteobacteria bacterium]